MDRINSPGVPTEALLWKITMADSLTQPTMRTMALVRGASSMAAACGVASKGPTWMAFKSTYPNAEIVGAELGGILENP